MRCRTLLPLWRRAPSVSASDFHPEHTPSRCTRRSVRHEQRGQCPASEKCSASRCAGQAVEHIQNVKCSTRKMPHLDDTENVQCSTGNQSPHYDKRDKLLNTENVQCSTGSLPRQDKQGLLLNTHRTFSVALGAYPVKINRVCC